MPGKRRFFINKFKKSGKYCRILSVKNNIFYQQFEVIENAFYYVIQYVGSEEEASEYRYDFVLGNSDDRISVRNITSSNKVALEDVHKSGQCVKLYYDTLKRFLNQKQNLEFEVQIVKKET
jgi:hypothetical protein